MQVQILNKRVLNSRFFPCIRRKNLFFSLRNSKKISQNMDSFQSHMKLSGVSYETKFLLYQVYCKTIEGFICSSKESVFFAKIYFEFRSKKKRLFSKRFLLRVHGKNLKLKTRLFSIWIYFGNFQVYRIFFADSVKNRLSQDVIHHVQKIRASFPESNGLLNLSSDRSAVKFHLILIICTSNN